MLAETPAACADINNGFKYYMYTYKRGFWHFSGHTLLIDGLLDRCVCTYPSLLISFLFIHSVSLYSSICLTLSLQGH